MVEAWAGTPGSALPERRRSPEEEELDLKREEVRSLADQVVAREREFVEISSQVQLFVHQRLFRLGRLYAELDDLQAQIAEALFARNPDDPVLGRRAQEARARASASREAAAAALERGPIRIVELTEEMRHTYRMAALRMHPDLGRTDADRALRTEYMMRLTEAYRRGDMERIQDLVALFEAAAEIPPDASVAEELVRAIRVIARLREALNRADRDMEELRRGDEYLLMIEAIRAEAEGRDLLDPAPLQERIERKRRRLQTIRGEGDR